MNAAERFAAITDPRNNDHPVPEVARYLASIGVSVMPVNVATKKPRIDSWKALQTEAVSPQQVEEWFRRWPDSGLSVVTGCLNGICVLDADSGKSGKPPGWIGLAEIGFYMPSAHNVVPIAKTQHAGFHFHYPYTPDIPQGTGIWGIPNLDGRSDGGYIIVPPTPGYRWLRKYATRTDAAFDEWAER
jgi:hypothetical protein